MTNIIHDAHSLFDRRPNLYRCLEVANDREAEAVGGPVGLVTLILIVGLIGFGLACIL